MTFPEILHGFSPSQSFPDSRKCYPTHASSQPVAIQTSAEPLVGSAPRCTSHSGSIPASWHPGRGKHRKIHWPYFGVGVWHQHRLFVKDINYGWLVVYLPLRKILISWEHDIPSWMESHKIPWFQSPPSDGNPMTPIEWNLCDRKPWNWGWNRSKYGHVCNLI